MKLKIKRQIKVNRPGAIAQRKRINVRGEALPRYVHETTAALDNLARDLGETAVSKESNHHTRAVIVRSQESIGNQKQVTKNNHKNQWFR